MRSGSFSSNSDCPLLADTSRWLRSEKFSAQQAGILLGQAGFGPSCVKTRGERVFSGLFTILDLAKTQ